MERSLMQQHNLSVILNYLINIYDISEKIYNFTIRYKDTNIKNAEGIRTLYKERAIYIDKLGELKKNPEYQELFLQNRTILGKEFKKIADMEKDTLTYLEKKTKDLAQELREVKNKKALLIYKKV